MLLYFLLLLRVISWFESQKSSMAQRKGSSMAQRKGLKRRFRIDGSDSLHLPALSLLCAWTWHLRRARRTKRGQAISTSRNETRTQNACGSVPMRIVSCSYTMIVPCTVLHDIPKNVTYKTFSKYFIQVLSFVTPLHLTQTATRVGPNYTLHSRSYLQNFSTSASQQKFDVKAH